MNPFENAFQPFENLGRGALPGDPMEEVLSLQTYEGVSTDPEDLPTNGCTTNACVTSSCTGGNPPWTSNCTTNGCTTNACA